MAETQRKRTSNLELPDVDEVLQLIEERESPRVGLQNTWIEDNPGTFRPIRDLATVALGVPDMFDQDLKVKTKDALAQSVAWTNNAKDELVKALLAGPAVADQSLLEEVFDRLSESDEDQESDAIFVFGAPSDARIDRAVKIYKAGLAPKIIISGRGPNWKEEVDQTEAERMAKRAIELGVPQEALILEKQALTIPDNVKRTVDIFEETGFRPARLTIITGPWVMLRATIDWVRFPEHDIQILRVAPPSIDPLLNRSGWFTYDKGVNLVLNEYAKILHETVANSYLMAQT